MVTAVCPTASIIMSAEEQGSSNGTAKTVVLVAVQDAPVAFDLSASIAKLQSLTAQAAQQARQASSSDTPVVVVFPEAFLSCYPRGYDVSVQLCLFFSFSFCSSPACRGPILPQFGASIGARTPEGRSWFRRYHQSSVPVRNVEGAEMRAIRKAASDNRVTLVVGVIERCDEEATGPDPAAYGSANPGGAATLYCACYPARFRAGLASNEIPSARQVLRLPSVLAAHCWRRIGS